MAATGDISLAVGQSRSLSKRVASQLKDAIVEGRFAFGENISEEKLAAFFGVSRTPVRDALNALQFTGLVEVRPKRGSFVFNPTVIDVMPLWEYREFLEREACTLAMAKNADALLSDLSTIVAQMESALREGHPNAYARLDAHFHSAFFVHCDNSYLRDAHNIGAARIAAILTQLCRENPRLRDLSLADHREMLAMLKARDLSQFADVLNRHIGRTLAVAMDSLPPHAAGASPLNRRISASA
ncbi:MAG: GntR family transcriptional regulator [Acuticoccus sp.]